MANNVILRYWKTHSMRNLTVFLGVAAVATMVVSKLSGNEQMRMISDVLALVDILHFFIHGYFYNQHRFLSDYLTSYSMPQKKIARSGAAYFAGFMLFLCMGIAVVREIYTGTLVAKLKVMVNYLLGLFFGGLLGHDGIDNGELIIANKNGLLDMMNQVAHQEESAWGGVINMVQTVLIILGVAVMAGLALAALIGAVKRLISKARGMDDRECVTQTFDLEQALTKNRRKGENPLDFSPDARVRRIYRKVINRQRRKGQSVPVWMTPAEIENMVQLPEQESYRQLHAVYEKARYSEAGCTDEDVSRAKAVNG